MADLFAEQARLRPALDRLLALAAGWAEPVVADTRPERAAAPSAATAAASAGGSRAGEAARSVVASAAAAAAASAAVAGGDKAATPDAVGAAARGEAPGSEQGRVTVKLGDDAGAPGTARGAVDAPPGRPRFTMGAPMVRARLVGHRLPTAVPERPAAREAEVPAPAAAKPGAAPPLPGIALAPPARATADAARDVTPPAALPLPGAEVPTPRRASAARPVMISPSPAAAPSLALQVPLPPGTPGRAGTAGDWAGSGRVRVRMAVEDDELEDRLADLLERAAIEAGIDLP